MTLNDAGIPDSIARALFDALQENRTGTQLPAMRISWSSRKEARNYSSDLATSQEQSDSIILAAKVAGEPYGRG